VIKEVSFNLDERLINLFFAPVRKKEDIIMLMMNIVQFIGISSRITIEPIKGRMVLRTSRTNRAFLYTDKKHFSISFPYKIIESEDGFEAHSIINGEISRATISKIKSILIDGEAMDGGCISSLANLVLDESLLAPAFWGIFRELIFMEDGYLRYDHDKERENGHIHPLNHLDIFYSNRAGFKVGLKSTLDEGELIDIMEHSSNCRYLNKPE
jgi:hypothetical protein